jgi:hypothetical protein
MNVWVKKTRRRVECRHCHQLIEVGEYQVVCTYFMKLKSSEKTWTKSMHFHAKDPYCWIDQAITTLDMKPYSEHRGRKADPISDTVKTARQKLLRRRASVMQRIRIEMEGLGRPEKLSHLADLLDTLRTDIEKFGGVPESWK